MRPLVFIFFIGLLSCQQKTASWTKPESITLNCDEYVSIETEQGILNNNVWNKFAADKDDWSQCLEKRLVDSVFQYGWSWSWPKNRRVIYAYPQIKVGSSPWLPMPKYDSRFPLKISKLKELLISYDVETHSNGNYNLATTMWLINEPNKSNEPNPDIIAAEIMIWTFATKNHFSPAGKKYKEFRDSDNEWEVWLDKDWTDKSGKNDNRWTNITFKAKDFSVKSKIDGLALLNYAIQENMISPDLLISDIELGNEVMSGSGLTWIKEFGIQIKNNGYIS